MSKFDEMIQTMKTSAYGEKKQFLQYLLQMAERAKHQFSQEDKQALLQYAYEEAAQMLRDIPEAESYKAKDQIFECEDYLLGIVMNLCVRGAANLLSFCQNETNTLLFNQVSPTMLKSGYSSFTALHQRAMKSKSAYG